MCETQEEVITKENKFIVKTVNLNTLTKKPSDISMFQNKLKNKQKLKENSRMIYDSINDFYIDEDYVKYLQTGEKESYTFSIKRDSIQKIENIVFNKGENGEYLSYLVKYDFTPEELKLMNAQQLNDKEVKYYPISFDDDGFMRISHAILICVEIGYYATNNGSQYTTMGSFNSSPEWISLGSSCFMSSDFGGGASSGANGPSSGYNNQSGNYGGGGNPGNNNVNTTGGLGIFTVINSPLKTKAEIKAIFQTNLNPTQLSWWNSLPNTETVNNIVEYLTENQNFEVDNDPNDYSKEMINFMIQNTDFKLDLKTSAKSPANIDLSEVKIDNLNDPLLLQKAKFNCIYKKLTNSPAFKKLFIDTFQGNVKPFVKFKVEDLPGNQNGGTVGETRTDVNNRLKNTIVIDKDLLSNANNMDIVKTIIHECIHA